MKIKSYLIVSFIILGLTVGKLHGQNTNYGTGAGKSGSRNTSIGYYAGDNVTGYDNSFQGHNAGKTNTSGYYNVFNGSYAGNANTTGYYNTFLGYRVGVSNNYGGSNTFIGSKAGTYNTSGSNNVFIGTHTGLSNVTGGNNVYLGYHSGSSSTGSNNIFLGYMSGQNETGSNKLYIENSSVSTPLIYGEFDNDMVAVHGRLGIGAKPINNAMLRLYKSSIPTFDIASDSARLEVGISTCTDCLALDSKPGDAVFNAFGQSENILLSIPSSDNDGGKYIGFTDAHNGLWMKILNDRKVRIDGVLYAREVQIKTDVWSDYVFDSDYELMTLKDVESFISKNKHLPDVPPACQVIEEGIDVGQMNVILLKKVEELTLYLIEMERRMSQMEKENSLIRGNQSVDFSK